MIRNSVAITSELRPGQLSSNSRDPGPQRAEAERGEDMGEPVGTDIDARHIDSEALLDDDDQHENGGNDVGAGCPASALLRQIG